MFKPGTDENNVQMSDVLCDFCHREWTEDMPFIEGHRGRTICGNCLALGYAEAVNGKRGTAPSGYTCTMCRENEDDRAVLDRTGERGWQSEIHEAAICLRCIERAAGTLHNDPDYDWRKPTT